MRKLIVCILLLSMISCSKNSNDTDFVENAIDQINEVETFDPNADYQLLFIGNSLTIENNLPLLVKNRGKEMGLSISCTTEVGPGFGLEDHWNIGLIQSQISSNFYDYVIIQQGPSSQAYGRDSLIEYGGRIAQLCSTIDTQLAYFMVWPSLTYYETFDSVITNYTDAANINIAINCNVGQIWKHHMEGSSDFPYYGTYGFHPSLEGSKLAARIIIQRLGLK